MLAVAAAKSLQSCPALCNPIDGSPPGSPIPGILQARMGCHFLLRCMKVKSESEVAQSCLTLSDPMDCSLPGSSVHGLFQARVLGCGAIAFSILTCEPLFFIFDCAGSPLLLWTLSRCGAQPSRRGSFSCCRAWARTSRLRSCGAWTVTPEPGESSWARGRPMFPALSGGFLNSGPPGKSP